MFRQPFLFVVYLLCVVARFPSLAAAEQKKFVQGEVLKVWVKGEKSGEGVTEARVGDTIVVEVRDLDGWLLSRMDEGVFADDKLVTAQDSGKPVRRLLAVRKFHRGIEVVNQILNSSNPDAGEPDGSEKWKAFRDRMLAATPGDVKEALKTATKADLYDVRTFFNGFMRAKLKDAVLELDQEALPGVQVLNPDDPRKSMTERPPEGPDNSYHWLEFRLEVTPGNSAVWGRLRSKPSFLRVVDLSVGVPGGERVFELPSQVRRVREEGSVQFGLNLIPRFRFFSAVVLWGVAFWILVRMARRTELLADPESAWGANGKRPISLARAQMAWWFMLVTGGFLFLWVVTLEINTLNDTSLWLIGIGSGTALGAALIGSQPDDQRVMRERYPLHLKADAKTEDVEKELNARLKELGELEARWVAENAEAKLAEVREQAERFRVQLADLKVMQKKGDFEKVLDQLLCERDSHSFHRYQMLVWTFVLGLIFVLETWRTLKLPDFNPTVLALMGISSGTYLGFKYKETAKGSKQGEG